MPLFRRRKTKKTRSVTVKKTDQQRPDSLLNRITRALGPIIPALLLDLVDFLTAGPIGMYFGMLIGCPMGYWICSRYKLPFLKRILGGLIVGIYCTLPFTGFAPAAVLIGIYARFHQPSKL